MRSAADSARVPFATVTFLGERADITGPDTAGAGFRQTTERRYSVRRQPVDNDQSDHAHQVTRGTWCLQLCPDGPIWLPGGGATIALKRHGGRPLGAGGPELFGDSFLGGEELTSRWHLCPTSNLSSGRVQMTRESGSQLADRRFA
jgi:hypothetical protein